jgi:hypothetical protein
MRVMVIVKATKDSEAGAPPDTAMLEAMTTFNEKLVAAGVMAPEGGDGLKPSSAGKRVRFSGKDRSVINGPFGEPNHLIAGYWVWNVKSMEEAVEWVKKCPNPMPGDSEIEIRPFFEMEDFGDNATPEIRAREQALRDQLSGPKA